MSVSMQRPRHLGCYGDAPARKPDDQRPTFAILGQVLGKRPSRVGPILEATMRPVMRLVERPSPLPDPADRFPP
jgi:hypothetical protein